MQLNTPGEYETIDWWHMTADQRKRALQLIARPPRKSKLAAAKKYGVDLTLLVESLSLTPTERARKLEGLIGAKKATGRSRDLEVIPELEGLLDLRKRSQK